MAKKAPRGKPFEKGHPGGPGRPVGSVNRQKVEFAKLLKAIADDPEYQANLWARAIAGDVTLDKEILARVLGSVPKVLQVDVPKPLVIDVVLGPERDGPAE